MTERLTKTANKNSKRPVKLTISDSWFLKRSKNREYSTKPVSAVPTARKNITIPMNLCHGKNVAFAEDSAPGKK